MRFKDKINPVIFFLSYFSDHKTHLFTLEIWPKIGVHFMELNEPYEMRLVKRNASYDRSGVIADIVIGTKVLK